MRQHIKHFDQNLNWQTINSLAEPVIQQACAIQQIPAPTFQEAARAAYVAEQFTALGLQRVETDTTYNVYGLLPGTRSDIPGVMVSAHTDTVFAADTDLTIHHQEALIHGPGLGDNSIGVAGLLGLVVFLQQQPPACNIWFVATSREEGLGDLGGMRDAYKRLADQIGCVINIEGLALGHVYPAGIAVRRLHITASAPGGHSWLHFGHASALHGLIQLGTYITTIQTPQNPRTTYNIGMIEGGEAINALATHAALWLDLRSEDQTTLTQLEADLRQHIDSLQTTDLRFDVNVVGDRPAGAVSEEHPLVQGALAALERVNIHGTLETGSTDGNIPLAAGCPTVTVGITRGGNAHRLDEYIETKPVLLGLRQLILLTLATAAYLSENNTKA